MFRRIGVSTISTAHHRKLLNWAARRHCAANASGGKSSDSQRFVTGRVHALLRIAGFSAALILGSGGLIVLTWPLLDARGLPWCYERALLASGPHTVPHSSAPISADAVQQLLAMLSEGDELEARGARSAGQIIVVSAAPNSGKTALLAHIAERHPVAYTNFRGIHDGATAVYATLSTLLIPTLGLGGQMVVAYHKLFNAMFDALTMSQQHVHVSYIIFCEVMQHFRAACYTLREKRLAYNKRRQADEADDDDDAPPNKGLLRKPVFIIDATEAIVEMIEITGIKSEAALFPLLFCNLGLRSALDEGLFHVVFLIDGKALLSAKDVSEMRGETQQTAATTTDGKASLSFGDCLPQLQRRATFVYLPPAGRACDQSDFDASLEEALQGDGEHPLLIAEALAAISASPEGATCGSIAKQLGVTQASVNRAVAALLKRDLVTPAMGTMLGKARTGTPRSRSGPAAVRFTAPPLGITRIELLRRVVIDASLRDRAGRLFHRPIEFGDLPPENAGALRVMWSFVLRFLWMRHGFFWPRVAASVADSGTRGRVVLEDYSSFLELRNGTELVAAGPGFISSVVPCVVVAAASAAAVRHFAGL